MAKYKVGDAVMLGPIENAIGGADNRHNQQIWESSAGYVFFIKRVIKNNYWGDGREDQRRANKVATYYIDINPYNNHTDGKNTQFSELELVPQTDPIILAQFDRQM